MLIHTNATPATVGCASVMQLMLRFGTEFVYYSPCYRPCHSLEARTQILLAYNRSDRFEGGTIRPQQVRGQDMVEAELLHYRQ